MIKSGTEPHRTKQAVFMRNQLWDSISPDALSIIDQITSCITKSIGCYWLVSFWWTDLCAACFPAEDIHHSDRVRVNSTTNSRKDPQTNLCLKLFHVLRISLQIFWEETRLDIKLWTPTTEAVNLQQVKHICE